MPADERDAEQAKKTQWIAIGVAGFGVFVSALLMVFYVRPYQVATGTLLDGNRLDWLTGEVFLSLGWAALFVPVGVVAYKLVGRSYARDENPEVPNQPR
jgi:hypothetical protein